MNNLHLNIYELYKGELIGVFWTFYDSEIASIQITSYRKSRLDWGCLQKIPWGVDLERNYHYE